MSGQLKEEAQKLSEKVISDMEKDVGIGNLSSDLPLDSRPPQQVQLDTAVEKRVVRKLDCHIIPLVMSLYLLAYLDRSNIGNAEIAGMKEDLNLDSDSYQWLLTIFYIAYVIFEPMTLMWKILPAHIWGALCVVCWGTAATLQSAAFNWSGMMAARFFLGMFEATFAPGVLFLLSFFYLRNELGLRCGFYLGAAPLATCFAGALAYAITSGDTALAPWRLLFLVEGLPVVILGAAAAFFFLPDSPETARFLTEGEIEVVKARNMRQTGQSTGQRGDVSWQDVRAALCDLKLYLHALMHFSANVSFSSLPVFLPTIILDMGFSRVHAQGLTAPPYFLAFLVNLLTCWIADRTAQRAITIAVTSIIGAIGYIMLATSSSVGVRYLGVYFAASGVFSAIANVLPWIMNNQGSATRRGTGIALVNLIGQCGPLLGTRLYPTNEEPFYRKGMWVCAAFMLFNGALAMILRARLVWENKKLDEKYGTEVKSGEVVEYEGPRYRYIL